MDVLTKHFQKVKTEFVNKTARYIPIQTHIHAVHVFHKIKQRYFIDRDFQQIEEQPIPSVHQLDLQEIDLSNPFLYRQHRWQEYYMRLRDEAPVHYQSNSAFGAFWSVTRHEDVLFVDRNHQIFSSEPIIMIGNQPQGLELEMFIAMDPPKHDLQRKAVQGVVTPSNLKEMESLIRVRTIEVLESLPIDEPFDFVDRVSIELTARMLATLLDFPYELRRKLVQWSEICSSTPGTTGGNMNMQETFSGVTEMASMLSALWHDKAARLEMGESPSFDVMSLLLTNPETKNMIQRPLEFLGNLALLIVGGNDTTRNSMSGGIWALHQYPEQFKKVKQNPMLIPQMVSEIIRWQTPLAYMRRVAKQDVILNGQFIRKGDKVVMWYASANRDERVFADPDVFNIEREDLKKHLSFGFGIHRCMGSRLAEMQLAILWEEFLKRFDKFEVCNEPELVQSNFVRGYSRMMVKLYKE